MIGISGLLVIVGRIPIVKVLPEFSRINTVFFDLGQWKLVRIDA
jgi:hypothetical protein